MVMLVPKSEAVDVIYQLVEKGLTFEANWTTYDSIVEITLTGGY